MVIHLLTVDNEDGDRTTTAHHTVEGARHHLFNYVRLKWNDIMEEQPPLKPGADEELAVAMYFEYMEMSEWQSIVPLTLPDLKEKAGDIVDLDEFELKAVRVAIDEVSKLCEDAVKIAVKDENLDSAKDLAELLMHLETAQDKLAD